MSRLIAKLKKHVRNLRLRPVRVFCFHQVSDTFESDTMWECDWTQTEVFKKTLSALKVKYTFVTLAEAYRHIASDKVRLRRYAALTADDGWRSMKNIIPWLAEQGIPVTLFLNPLYLDGSHRQRRETEKLLNEEEIAQLVERYAPFVTIASHGWSHKDCMKMTQDEFESNVMEAETRMAGMDGKVPFYAFTYGRNSNEHVAFLRRMSLVPVLMDGRGNYDNSECIHRECIDGGR